MNEWEKVLKAVRETAGEKRLPCETALEIARDLQVPAEMVGRAADELKVKIVQCRLGCFK